MDLKNLILDQLSSIITPDNSALLVWAAASAVIALLMAAAARSHQHHLAQMHTTLGTRWYGYFLPMLAPVINLVLLTVAVTVFRKKSIPVDQDLYVVLSNIALCWLGLAAIFATTRSIGKTVFSALVIIPYSVLGALDVLPDVIKALADISFNIGKFDITAYHLVKFFISVVLLFWVANAFIRGFEFSLTRMPHVRSNTQQLFRTLFRVGIYIAGGLFALSTLGIDLTALAIFGGALGVGLGFGLQKIASNFISGIILLLERSVDVGDMIEMPTGNVLGIVRKTGARYTIVETFDGREVMIPNEDFITQRVINWTFSSPRGLLKIPVIVSYGSDLERAKALMIEAAKENPRALSDPKPNCILQEFTDTAVSFMLFVWVGDIREKRLTTQSDILLAVWRKFRDNGIGIPHQVREDALFKPSETSTGG